MELLDRLGAPILRDARPLTWQEVHKMYRAGIEFGSHTVSHSSLPALSDEPLREEIESSRDLISVRLGSRPTAFAYPFGDVDDRVAAVVEGAGFRCAVTVRKELCRAGTECMHLPRVMIRECSADQLMREIAELSDLGKLKRTLQEKAARVQRLIVMPLHKG